MESLRGMANTLRLDLVVPCDMMEIHVFFIFYGYGTAAAEMSREGNLRRQTNGSVICPVIDFLMVFRRSSLSPQLLSLVQFLRDI